jgi:hypothetical protein
MFDLRHLRRSRRLGRVLAVCVAYALAVQAVLASVGTGMSAFAASDHGGLIICGQVSAPGPSPAGDRHRPNSAPSCPFCFVAAQSVGHAALTGAAPAAPAYAGLAIAAMPDRNGRSAFVPRFRRVAGDPRAPPAFSA